MSGPSRGEAGDQRQSSEHVCTMVAVKKICRSRDVTPLLRAGSRCLVQPLLLLGGAHPKIMSDVSQCGCENIFLHPKRHDHTDNVWQRERSTACRWVDEKNSRVQFLGTDEKFGMLDDK